MNGYTPKLSHAVLLILSALALFIAGGIWLTDDQFIASTIASAIFVAFSFIVMAWITNQERIDYYNAVTHFAEAIRNLDQDQWQALGIKFPTLRIKWHGKPIHYIQDTDITQEEFTRFLDDSNPSQISPRRNWSNGQEARNWTKIQRWLEAEGFIIKQSASGSHSYLWKGQAYFTLKERYAYDYEQIAEIENDAMSGRPATER